MKKTGIILCTLVFLTAQVFAQDISEPEVRKETNTLNEVGDQFINIALAATFPLNFGGKFPLYKDANLAIGGSGTLGFHKFLTTWFAVGFDVSFGYHPTIQKNMFTYIPIMLCATVQPTWKKFEFPLTLGVGAAVETYISNTYFPGLVLKPQFGVYYRATPSWSFGMKGEFMYMPQFYKDSQYNDYGIFASALISARYHF